MQTEDKFNYHEIIKGYVLFIIRNFNLYLNEDKNNLIYKLK